MVIFELRSHTGKKVGGIIGILLALLSISTMFSKLNVFSEGETVCVIMASALWGFVTLFTHLKTNHPFNQGLCEISFYMTLILLIGLSVSLYV